VNRTVLLSVGLLLLRAGSTAAQALPAQLRERVVAQHMESLGPLVTAFYEHRAYRPGWLTDSGPSPAASELLRVIEAARAQGLDPEDYPHAAIHDLLAGGRTPDTLARLDVLLTRAFLAYGSDVSRGRVHPTAADSHWVAVPHATDLVAVLATALDSGNVGAALDRLPPPQPGYAALQGVLQRYRAIAAAGGWRAVPAGADLLAGARDVRVGVLRARLIGGADLAPGEDTGTVYDPALEQAVRQFQARHGLEPDGVVGAATRAALNVPVDARIRQIALNLERWRWLPRELGERYVMVNSAAFTLEAVEGARQTLASRTVVGRADWPTPVVSAHITGLIFSPVWNIPRTIALEEVLPLVRQDRQYLERHHIAAFDASEPGGREVDPATVDWSALTDETFNLQLEQAPGGDNPLGGVKIVFGSRFNVALHDTPVRSLFLQRVRALSHGCIRVEHAADLATWMLQDSVRWTADSVHTLMTQPTERIVTLAQPIPVYLTYWTAWVDEDGSVEFRDDVYGWDTKLATALADPRTQGRVSAGRAR
jgi:murein L,D-transpeptidase YcbB/YkuD